MTLTLRVDDTTLNAAFARLGNRDLTPLMRSIAGIMADAVEENFAQEGRPKWLPLKPSTIKQRTRRGYWPGRILQQRGQLAASISAQSDATSAVVGTNLVYAAIHQLGGYAGRGRKTRIEPRPFLVLTAEDLGEIRDKVTNYFLSG